LKKALNKVSIPFTKPLLSVEESQAAAEVIHSGWVSQGPKVAEFEKMVADYVGARYAIATPNCTSALYIALMCLGIGGGDEVIVPSFTFVASANSILHTGATPILVDIDPRTYNLDVTKIEPLITPRTKAIMPVHQIGLPADMDPILNLAQKHNLHLVEDAACALGATYKGRKVGCLSELSCFSFHPRKVITTGEGGMITTDSEALAERARLFRSHGASVSDLARHKAGGTIYEQYVTLGYNYRMTDIQAALGIEQMKKLDFILKRRAELAKRYNDALAKMGGIGVPYLPEYATHTYQSYLIRLNGKGHISRDELLQKMVDQGISCRRGIPPIHLEPYWRARFGQSRLPVTEQAAEATLFLPIYPGMTGEEQEYVIDTLKRLLKGGVG
jgi:perosamine synthetase